MNENEILDMPIPTPQKQKKWQLTFATTFLMSFLLLLQFPFDILVIKYYRYDLIYHISFFINLILIGLALYFFIKKIDSFNYNYIVVFIWASFITILSNYIYSIINMPFAFLITQLVPDFIPGGRGFDFSFYAVFVTVGFLHGGLPSLGIYFLIKKKNYWLLPLIVLALWVLCNFFQIPYIIDF